MRKIRYILLDYDGTLGDSEHKAFEACCAWLNECLADHGIERRFTVKELIEEFIGCSFRGMITRLAEIHNFALSDEELERLVKEEENRVIAKLSAELEAAPGVNAVLARLFGSYKLAVVSSSALGRLQACLRKAEQERYFEAAHLFSASSSLAVPTSKPHGAIYVHSLEVLGAIPDECVAVEDSKNGVLSACNAKIKMVVGYVGCYPAEEREQAAQTLRAAGAVAVITHWDEFPAVLADIEAGVYDRSGCW